jgi:hypothetical protein
MLAMRFLMAEMSRSRFFKRLLAAQMELLVAQPFKILRNTSHVSTGYDECKISLQAIGRAVSASASRAMMG